MASWVKWTIAGFFAVVTIGSLYTAATQDNSGEFGRMNTQMQLNELQYKTSLCNAGNKAACDELNQNK